jgi:hypothetical protein
LATPTADRRAITVKDVVAIYGISKALVYRERKKGNLPGFMISNQLRFWPEDVEAAFGARPAPASERPKLLSPEDIAFLSEIASAAPALTEAQRDQIRAAFRQGGAQP